MQGHSTLSLSCWLGEQVPPATTTPTLGMQAQLPVIAVQLRSPCLLCAMIKMFPLGLTEQTADREVWWTLRLLTPDISLLLNTSQPLRLRWVVGLLAGGLHCRCLCAICLHHVLSYHLQLHNKLPSPLLETPKDHEALLV